VLDSCGSSGTAETPQAHCAEEAQRTPHGKRASWSGNWQTSLPKSITWSFLLFMLKKESFSLSSEMDFFCV